MRFAIITYAEHVRYLNLIYSYGPYVKEINLWCKYVDQVNLVAPFKDSKVSKIDLKYDFENVNEYEIPSLHFKNISKLLYNLINVFKIVFQLIKVFRGSDHIHLRCPGNVGLIACLVQIFFPYKKKSVKYAGNWDPKANQPISYKIQKWILSNTFLTKNVKVLVYGKWENQSKNIVPFYTASYKDEDKVPNLKRSLNDSISFVFAGTLSPGKRPNYTLELIKRLISEGINCKLDIFGDGPLKYKLEQFIVENELERYVKLHGNVKGAIVKSTLQKAHFVILPSKSEGWPKIIAEGMFLGAIPLATDISCVKYMLGSGSRGFILSLDAGKDAISIKDIIQNEPKFHKLSKSAEEWSRLYTLDKFENDIKTILEG